MQNASIIQLTSQIPNSQTHKHTLSLSETLTMSTLETISTALNLVDAKKESLKKAFDDLQFQSSIFSSSLPLSWPHLDSHFTSIQNSLTHRFHLLQTLNPEVNDPPLSPSKSPNETPKDAIFTPLPNCPSNKNDGSGGVFPKNYVVPGSVVPRYELSVLCEKMDWKGLVNYVNAHYKDRVAVQAELPAALRCAPDAAEMVVEAVEGFGHWNNGLKDNDLRRMKKSCIIVLKQLRVAAPSLSLKTREKALKLAKEWKERMKVDNVNTLGVLGFFYFVAAYGFVSEFIIDELIDLSAMSTGVAENEEFPELCRIIGLADRVPDIVQKLINRGKHILAVKYVFEFNLADKIPPVSILKACVDESKKLSKRLSEEGKSLIEVTARETHALKSVIKIIENHKLEFAYPRASLEQRIEELKRQKRIMKCPAPASAAKLPQHQHQHQHQQQHQKRRKQKLKQQQGGIKHPRTSAPVGPASMLKSVNNGNSTIHLYQQHHVHPSGVFPEHPNPYMSSPDMPFGMVAPTPAIPPYIGPSAGPYGLAGVPVNPSGNSSLGGSHLNSSELHMSSGYSDRASTYGGIGLQYYYSGSNYPQ